MDNNTLIALGIGALALILAIAGIVLPESLPFSETFPYGNLTDVPSTFPYGNLTDIPQTFPYGNLTDIPSTFPYGNLTGVPNVNLMHGLVVWLPFDGVSLDRSGDFDVVGAYGISTVVGKYGEAFSFDGINDFVNVSYAYFGVMKSFSVSFWALFNTTDVLRGIISRYGSSGQQFEFFWNSSNCVQFYVNGGASDNNVGTNVTTSLGVWHYVAGVYDGSSKIGSLFIDNICVGSRYLGFTLANPSEALIVSEDAFFSGRYFNGFVDDMRYYNRVLNQAEITELYNLP